VTGARVRCSRLTSGEPWVSMWPLAIAGASRAPHHRGRRCGTGRGAGVVEVGVGEHMRGDRPPDQLAGEAAAPAHPRVNHDGVEQVDVEGAARPAVGQARAGRQLVQRRKILEVALMRLPSARALWGRRWCRVAGWWPRPPTLPTAAWGWSRRSWSCLPSIGEQASGRGPPVDRRGRSAPTPPPGHPEPPRALGPGRTRRGGKRLHRCLQVG
jgi:hypothetical protein